MNVPRNPVPSRPQGIGAEPTSIPRSSQPRLQTIIQDHVRGRPSYGGDSVRWGIRSGRNEPPSPPGKSGLTRRRAGHRSSHRRPPFAYARLRVVSPSRRPSFRRLARFCFPDGTVTGVTEFVRQQQPAAALTASNRGCLHEDAVAPDRSAVSLLHLAEQAPMPARAPMGGRVGSGGCIPLRRSRLTSASELTAVAARRVYRAPRSRMPRLRRAQVLCRTAGEFSSDAVGGCGLYRGVMTSIVGNTAVVPRRAQLLIAGRHWRWCVLRP